MSQKRGALWVSLGIFLSRISGLIRDRVFAHYLGNSDAAGAFRAALRIPNFLQNLFGEGVLSASFIPVYSRLLSEGKEKEAADLASVVASILGVVTLILVSIGIWLTPALIDLVAPGFTGDVRALTIELVRLLFPGVGLLVLSAWCLGILNSHRRFFLSYFAPVLWNSAMILALWHYGHVLSQAELALKLAWAATLGSGLQLLIQIPTVLRLSKNLSLHFSLGQAGRQVFKQLGPVLMGRGVVQLSAYIDSMLSSFLGPASVAGLAYAQTIYLLPISLFGMSVAAAELPELSRVGQDLSQRLTRGLKNISFFVVPSLFACLFLNHHLVTLLYRTGQFKAYDVVMVGLILAGYAIGLLAATWGRLYSSAFYALGDTKTPFQVSVLRVLLSSGLGYLLAFPLRDLWLPWAQELARQILILASIPDPSQGLVEATSNFSLAAVGLTIGSSIGAWLEMLILQFKLTKKIPELRQNKMNLLVLFASSLAALIIAWALQAMLQSHPFLSGFSVQWSQWIESLLIVSTFGLVYLPLARTLTKRIR